MKKSYLQHIGADFPASIVVLLVAIPLCLGIALGSGAPLFSGIIAGIVGGIVIGILSGSHLSVSGPAAGLTVIVATAITRLQVFDAFLLAVVLAGVFQVVFGYLKAGVIGDYVPNAVIKGMLAAIGLILILKQLPHLVGYDADFEGDMSFKQADNQNTLTEILASFEQFSVAAILIGLISLALLSLWETKPFKQNKLLQLIPGPLVVVLTAIGIHSWIKHAYPELALEETHLVNLPIAADTREFLSFFTFPDFAQIINPAVWSAAFTIALVASLETLLGIEAVDKLDPLKRVSPPNQELKAQGIGNMISGLLGGLPMTSVVVRSSANVAAGGKTKMSTILHGILMLLLVAFIPDLLNLIPLSALAAVLIFTGYKLAKVALFKEFYAKGWDQFAPFMITILAILFTDLLMGICIGIIAGLFFLVRSNFRSSILMVNDNNYYMVRLRKDVSFLNKPVIKKILEEIPENAEVIVDATRTDFIDKDVIEEINSFIQHAHLKNIRFSIKKSRHKPTHLLFHSNTHVS
jgi:MFS superfamily sulfate permease-like transporter